MIFPRSRISDQIKAKEREEKKLLLKHAKLEAKKESKIKKFKSNFDLNFDIESANSSVKNNLLKLPLTKKKANDLITHFFSKNSWTALPFQKIAWKKYAEGYDLLINVPTGSGKTYAAYMQPLVDILTEDNQLEGYRILYISPLRALVRDIQQALIDVSEALNIPIQVDAHMSDSKINTKSKKSLGQVLVTTPESFGLLMANPNKEIFFKNLKTIIVDEAHDIFSSKRGSLLELDLAHLRSFASFRKVVVSATMSNGLELASRVDPKTDYFTVTTKTKRKVHLDILPNDTPNKLGYFGFMGLHFIHQILSRLNLNASHILFANTRSQAESWFRRLREIATSSDLSLELHHGSLDREERHRVETDLKMGKIDLLVATSSLELGVDFPEVENIFQIGSPKSAARAIQRAGRGFHKPEQASYFTIVPTSVFDYVEYIALNNLLETGNIEPVESPKFPIDVLIQYLQTRAIGDGFKKKEIFKEISSTVSFSEITFSQFESYLNFLISGSPALVAYPNFLKLHEVDGSVQFVDRIQQRRHMLNMGTIVDNVGVRVKYLKGGYVGSLDESFVARLKKDDLFSFAGRVLKVVNLKDLVLTVRLATGNPKHVAVWQGSYMSLNSLLSEEIRHVLDQVVIDPSILEPTIRKVFELQDSVSAIPRESELLIEQLKTKDGYHTFIYTFEGRAANEGIGHLLAYRLSLLHPDTFTVSCNDFGIEILTQNRWPEEKDFFEMFSRTPKDLEKDIVQTFNYPEIAKRKFREVASISGLVQSRQFTGAKTDRQVQISSSVLFDVLKKYDPENILIKQAETEVLATNLNLTRIQKAFERFNQQKLLIRPIKRLSPFSFPLYVERVRTTISTENLESRIERILREYKTTT